MPTLDEGSLTVNFIRPVTIGLSHSIELEEKVQELISSMPEVSHVFAKIGTSEVATDPMGSNVGDTYIMLKPIAQWPTNNGQKRTKSEFVADLTNRLQAEIPGQNFLISQPIELRFNELLEGTRSSIAVKVFGEDQATLAQIGQRISQTIAKIPGGEQVEVENKGKISVLDIVPKAGILKQLGVSSREVMETVGAALGGEEVGVFYEGTRRVPIVVRLADHQRSDITAIQTLPVGIAGSTTAPLKDVATIKFKESPSTFTREETKRRIAVLVNPRGVDTENFVRLAQSKVEQEVKIPPGYYIEWSGNFKNLKEAKLRLALLGPLALVLVLMMVYAAFGNVVETILIFLCVPFALVGGTLGLMIKGLPFSVSAGVGFIALSGIAVLNGVVLVNFFNQLRDRGMSGTTLIKRGTLLRLRPVLMTALVEIFGFLPMALSHGMGAEVQQPIASVVIGGVISSTILTLIILPVLYLTMERSIVRFSHQKQTGDGT